MGFFKTVPGVKLVHLDQRTPAWHSWRAGEDLPDGKARVTGTMAAIIAGDSVRAITPYQLWKELTGRAPVPEPSDYLRKLWDHGTKMEPIARAAYTEYTGNVVREICVEHPMHAWAGASLDGLSPSCDVILEVKCPISQRVHNIAKAGKVPSYYLGQCHWQLLTTPTATELHFWSYFPNDEHGVTTALVVVQRDKAFEEWLLNEAISFRACVVTDRPPASNDWLIAAKGFRQATQDLEESQARADAFQESLKGLMPDEKDTMEGGGVRLTRYMGKIDIDYESIAVGLGIDKNAFKEAVERTRKPGLPDYDKAMKLLQADETRLKELEEEARQAAEDAARSDGKVKWRVTVSQVFDQSSEPAPVVHEAGERASGGIVPASATEGAKDWIW